MRRAFGRIQGRCLNTDFIAATDLGEWQNSILAPRDTPIEVNSTELFEWGGIANISNWPKEIIEERRRNKVRTRGVGVITHFVKQLLARAVTIKRGVRAQRLVVEDGRVTGVSSIRAGSPSHAASCSLAAPTSPTQRWLRPTRPCRDFSDVAPPSIDGDGIVMGAELGAQTRTIRNNLAVFLGFNVLRQAHPGEEPLFRMVGIGDSLSAHHSGQPRRAALCRRDVFSEHGAEPTSL